MGTNERNESTNYRYISLGAKVVDGQDETVGVIQFVKQGRGGRYQWQAGAMDRFPAPRVDAQGWSDTYDDAKAKLDEALKNRRATG